MVDTFDLKSNIIRYKRSSRLRRILSVFADFFCNPMVETSIIISIIFLCLFSVFDIIIFNEEILLAFCFLTFLFYCFNTLSESAALTFDARAAKFEHDLLITFSSSKALLLANFSINLKFQFFINKFGVISSCLFYFYNSLLLSFSYKTSWVYYQACLVKLNELTLATNDFIAIFQKLCVTHLLYSLILIKSNNSAVLTNIVNTTNYLLDLKKLSMI